MSWSWWWKKNDESKDPKVEESDYHALDDSKLLEFQRNLMTTLNNTIDKIKRCQASEDPSKFEGDLTKLHKQLKQLCESARINYSSPMNYKDMQFSIDGLNKALKEIKADIGKHQSSLAITDSETHQEMVATNDRYHKTIIDLINSIDNEANIIAALAKSKTIEFKK